MSALCLPRPQASSYTCRACLVRLTRASSRAPYQQRASSTASKRPNPTPLSYPARTRFAPSPTGYLHLGSLRTALFNYLLAKRTKGQFILRIEDTDRKRTIEDAEQRVLDDLRWAGLQWDEGPEVGGPYGPYRQSERSEVYQEHANQLLENGHAYRCFCSAERLTALASRRQKLGLATDYDRACADVVKEESDDRASRGEAHTIRLRVPDQYTTYNDLIYGPVTPPRRRKHVVETSFDDPILLKSDGLPTYHLANVVDDHLMRITTVIRGSEWMPSTPKHIALYSAFGWEPPAFAHVGLLVDSNGNKLSKRNFDSDVRSYTEMEIFPETLTNFAALLGWSHREKSDVMDLAELISKFSLKFTKGNTTVTFGKLHHLQRKHATRRIERGGAALDEIVAKITELLTAPDTPYKNWRKMVSPKSLDEYIRKILEVDSENYTNANEYLYRNAYFFTPLRPFSATENAETPPIASSSDIPMRSHMFADVSEQDWNKDKLMEKMHEVIDGRKEGRKGAKEVYTYFRRIVTGREDGVRLYDVFRLLGRVETLRRLGVEEARI